MPPPKGVAARPRPSRKCKRSASSVKPCPRPKKSPKISSKSSCMIRREAWKVVLKYLPAMDQLTLSQVDPFIKQTISAEGELKIDQKFLQDHPVKKNVEFYMEIGALVPNLTLSCLKNGHSIDTILSYFKNVRHLTLDQIKLGRIPNQWPRKIETLRLFKCDTDTIETILLVRKKRSCCIRSLHVIFPKEIPKDLGIKNRDSTGLFLAEDDDDYDSSGDYSDDSEDYNSCCFESLTVECDEATCPLLNLFSSWKSKTFTLKCNKLITVSDCIKDARKIIITAEKLNRSIFTRTLPKKLLHYELNVPRWNEHTDCKKVSATSEMLEGYYKTLQTLILPACPESIDWLLPFDKLKELTIREPLRTKEEKASLDFLQKRKPKLIINYTIDPNPVFNQILRLNDDCLVKVFDKITCHKDLLNVRLAHPRFQRIFNISAKHVWNGKMGLMYGMREYSAEEKKELIELLGPSIKDLDARFMPESEFLAILPKFPNLAKLHLHPPKEYCNNHSIRTFPHLQSIHLDAEVNPDYLDKLLRHLNPTLTHFAYETSGFPNAFPLQNLQSIAIAPEMLDANFLHFWELNTQLTKLELLFTGISSPRNWETLGQLTNLKNLTMLMEDRAAEGYDEVFVHHFPNLRSLESFTVSTGYYEVLKAMLPKIGPELKSLEISFDNSNYYTLTRDIQHMVNLERLYISFDDYILNYTFDVQKGSWQTLESVKYLTYDVNSTTSTLEIVKAMPNLKEMINRKVKDNGPFLAGLRDYLKAKRRTLLFNNEIMP